MEANELSHGEVLAIATKLILQKYALMQVQDKIDSIPECENFLVYDNITPSTSDGLPIIVNILEHDLAKILGYNFMKYDLPKVLDALVDERMIAYRVHEEKVYYVQREMYMKRKFIMLEIMAGLVHSVDSSSIQKIRQSTKFNLDTIAKMPKKADDSSIIKLELDVNEQYGNGTLRVRFTQSGYKVDIKRFNSKNEKMPASLRITQWILEDGYRDGLPVDIEKLRKELKYAKTGSGLVAEIFPRKYKFLKKLFVMKSGVNHIGLKRELTAKDLAQTGYNTGQLQKELIG